MTDINDRIETFVEKLQNQIQEQHQKVYQGVTPPMFTVDPKGRKFTRIIREHGQRSVYCFIDRTNGDILKPASWKAPAKHARGNIFANDFGLHCCGVHGVAYLR